MTTEPRRKRILSGYLPNGTVVKIRTAAPYSYLSVRYVPATSRRPAGYVPIQRHYHADTAREVTAALPEAVIIGLTEATLRSGDPFIITKWNDGRRTTYPRCYACDKAGLKVSTDYLGNRRPACAGRHRDNPAWAAS